MHPPCPSIAPAHGLLRLVRTAFLAGACTGLSWAGHHLWADTASSGGGFLLATAILTPVLWHFTRIMRGFGDVFAVLASVQIVLHLALQGSGGAGAAFAGTGHSAHGLLTHTLGLSPGMLLAHLWAALLASALLAHGESALWFLAVLLRRALPPLLREPRLPLGGWAPAPGAPAASGPRWTPVRAHGPRGPPGSLLTTP
ncbi:copper resistance protein [Nocardiopsis aegyptia]|uniref:copper resistance protein n=1 Tax=Nocardiopsis aegyptia TaxID=220378 RepID=UPI00366CE2E9